MNHNLSVDCTEIKSDVDFIAVGWMHYLCDDKRLLIRLVQAVGDSPMSGIYYQHEGVPYNVAVRLEEAQLRGEDKDYYTKCIQDRYPRECLEDLVQ